MVVVLIEAQSTRFVDDFELLITGTSTAWAAEGRKLLAVLFQRIEAHADPSGGIQVAALPTEEG
jgi:hypothetical protein